MAYKLIVTQHANALLDRLVAYLAVQKQNPQAATHLLNEVTAIYDRLEENPMQFPVSRDPFLAAKHYRAAVASGMNYVLVFKVEDATVIVHGIFYGRENYPQKLK